MKIGNENLSDVPLDSNQEGTLVNEGNNNNNGEIEVPRTEIDARRYDISVNQNYWQTKLNIEVDKNLATYQEVKEDDSGARQTPGKTPKSEAALATVREDLANYLLDDVDYNELKEIESTLRELNKDELNYVLGNLSPDEWQRWGEALNEKPGLGDLIHPFHGYNTDEQKNLFSFLAQNASADNLAKMYDSVSSNKDSAGWLIEAVGQNASDGVISEFVKDMAGKVASNSKLGADLAKLIGGMDSDEEIGKLLSTLKQNGQLENIINAALQFKTDAAFGSSNITLTYHAEALESLLNAAAKSTNNQLKADIFEMVAPKLDYLRGEDNLPGGVVFAKEAIRQIQNGMTALLNSDTTGIVTILEQRGKGLEMTSYIQSMIESNRVTELQDLVTDLLSSNNHNQTPSAFLDTPVSYTTDSGKTVDVYQNARSLGYFLGSLHNAIGNITENRQGQADKLTNIFGAIGDAAGAFDPPAVGVVSAALKLIANTVIKETTGAANKESWKMSNVFNQMLNGLNGGSYAGPGKGEFYAAFSFYALQN